MEEYFNKNEEIKPISVFVKLNEKNEIIDISSNIFLNNIDGWIKVDEGYGDKFAHAQSQYFDKPLNENGKYNYKYNNGEIINL